MRFYELWQKILNEAIEEQNPINIQDERGFANKLTAMIYSIRNEEYIREFALYCAKDAYKILLENNEDIIELLKPYSESLNIYEKCFELVQQLIDNPKNDIFRELDNIGNSLFKIRNKINQASYIKNIQYGEE